MFRKTLDALLLALAMAGPASAAVTITASASGVQKGGSLTFTATTTESDPVVKVTFSYEGTSGTDQDSSAPYEVTKVMDWTTLENLTVTATFDFQSIPDQQDTVDVDVVDLSLTGPSQPIRGTNASFVAQTQPTGLSVSSWSWTYENTLINPDPTWTDTSNSDDRSIWSGKMAVSGTVDLSATVLGVSCTKDKSVTVRARTGTAWTTPVACIEDNDANFGSALVGTEVALGELRDKDSDQVKIIVPQASGDWEDGVTLSEITSGPNDGAWYVQSNILEIDQETVINQYIKSGGPDPDPCTSENWYDHNNASGGCLDGIAGDFVQAVKNHEYRGTPSTAESLEGHFGRIEYELNNTGDPAASIEDLIGTSESGLLTSVNDVLQGIEDDLSAFHGEGLWSDAGPNWGGSGALGSGKNTHFDGDGSGCAWETGCTFGPEKF